MMTMKTTTMRMMIPEVPSASASLYIFPSATKPGGQVRLFDKEARPYIITYCDTGWMDGWMGGWVDGWVGGWMDGWMGRFLDPFRNVFCSFL